MLLLYQFIIEILFIYFCDINLYHFTSRVTSINSLILNELKQNNSGDIDSHT